MRYKGFILLVMAYKVQSCFLNELQILEHFVEMEKRFKRNTERPFFPSLDYFIEDEQDRLSLLRRQVENMTYFIGLGNIPNKIKIEKLKDAAAVINLRESSFIDITIDEVVFNNNEFDKIFGTLAHELGHKLLYQSGLYFKGLQDIENEIYADLSTFYLGFGKFVLRGFNIVGDRTKSSSGYLTPETYIMAYVLTEYLNGRDPDTTALSEDIINMIYRVSPNCKTRWIKKINDENAIKEQYKSLSTPIGTSSTLINLLNVIENHEHLSIRKFINQLNQICLQKADENPLPYRKVAIAYSAFQHKNDVNSFLGEPYLNELLQIVALLIIERKLNLDEVLNSISHRCPNCDNPINNPAFKTKEGKRIFHIKCNKCQTQFVIDNDIYKIKELIQKQIDFINEQTFSIIQVSGNSVLSKLITSIQVHERKDLDYRNRIVSLERRIDNLVNELSEWRSMNWWQRLWHRRKK